MLSANNLLSPASGRPIAVPSQDIVLGNNYLTKVKTGDKGEGKCFSSSVEVEAAYQREEISLHAKIKVRGINRMVEPDLSDKEHANPNKWKDWTTVGRVLFNSVIPPELGHVNANMGKKELAELVDRCYRTLGHARTVTLLDDLKTIGFRYATRAGLSISIEDMLIPKAKDGLVKEAKAQVVEVERQAKLGLITESERYNKIIDLWTRVTDRISDLMFDEMKKQELASYKGTEAKFNSIYMMANSGARGSAAQIRQLAGMRGLMAKPQKKLTGGVGEIIESRVISHFREGLTVLEYFISTHGARKGLADTALKTADAGYLTRRLCDVAQDVTITEEDCGTVLGLDVSALKEGEDVIEPLRDRILGTVASEDVTDPHVL